jgi:hypothetical protein
VQISDLNPVVLIYLMSPLKCQVCRSDEVTPFLNNLFLFCTNNLVVPYGDMLSELRKILLNKL